MTVQTTTPAPILVDHQIVIDPANTKRRPPLTPDEARLLTSEIVQTTNRLWLLVTEAHDREAHLALGFQSWDDYVRAELGISPSRSYQLLHTGHVMREMAAAGLDVATIQAPPARVVARIKDRLPAVRKATRQAIREGSSTEAALKALAREPRRATDPAAGPPVDKPDGRKNAQVRCPACEGKGKVPRPLAGKLRAWIKTVAQ